ncbi:MAG: hypothetical protein ACR2KK_20025 [Acidimicrobiales bacterium]
MLLGAVGRGVDAPATLRRYHPDLTPVTQEISDEPLVDVDHTLAMARQWGGLPVDTVVIEVEPAETGFGLTSTAWPRPPDWAGTPGSST